MFDLYIYYQVTDAHAPALQALIRTMQATLAAEYGVVAGLKRRPESDQGMQTWMEIYTGAGPAFGGQLDDAAEALGVNRLVEGIRHTEVFTEMPPCA